MKMQKKGMIFDFNGTLVLDSHIHKAVWQDFFPLHGKGHVSDEEFAARVLGRGNTRILLDFFSPITPEEIEQLTYEKEAEYRRRAVLDPSFHLVAGVEEFLDFLKSEGYPMMIATGSEIRNVELYYDFFHLDRWFDWDKIIYDDGSFGCKPDPEIYLRSAKLLERHPSECVVFEDSLSGVLAAKRASIGCVLGFGPGATDEDFESVGGVDNVYDDFSNWRNFPIK
jgi:beta-phosphoglucomutase-like phosphatase (HAD superfamily)